MAQFAKQMSDVDVAYQVLAGNGAAMYFRDLITKVLEVKGRPVHSLAPAMAEIHTQINMDSRFVHMGKSMWGLAEWLPQKGSRNVEETAATVSDMTMRREKLLADIQQDYPPANPDSEENE